MAAAMVRQQSGRFRSGRFRGRHGSGEENIQLDFTKDPIDNTREVLKYLVKQSTFSKAKKIGYLNAFVRLIEECGGATKLGFPLRSILICLSINLLHASKEVKAGCLRVIKHLVKDEESLQVLLDLHLDYLIARSLDLCLDNEIERIHAQKLLRRLVSVVAAKLPRSVIAPLVAIGCEGAVERDRMVRASLACLCELTYENPELVSQCGGIGVLLRKILDCHQYPRINESLVATILHLINYPATRHYIKYNTDLEQLIAPFTDCHFSYTGESTDDTVEDKESRFAASRMALVTVMRSWPGIIRFCRPDGTSLQSLVGILYLPFTDIRQAVVEMIYEVFQMTVPEWTTDFTEALISIDPSKMKDEWMLTEGFVASEGKSILANTASVRPNLVENHLALLLSAWIGAGLLDALVEVIITTDNELFIRAVILLGEIMFMANRLLPAECNHHSHYLPSLMACASSFDIPHNQRHHASIAVNYLDRIHSLKKRGPIPCSLYLEQLVRHSGLYKERPVSLNVQKNKLLDIHVRKRASSSEEVCLQALKDTKVSDTPDFKQWNLDLTEYILKWPDAKLRKLEDQIHIKFVRHLGNFFKPTNHLFSRLESSHELQRKYAVIGCQFVDFLVKCTQEEGQALVTDLLSDISLCLSEVALQRIAPESVMSPPNILNTLSHYYFLLIGRFSISQQGDRYLEKAGIYQHLLDIVSSAPQDSYVKLITSSLYYGREGNTRAVLTKALCAGQESGRVYSTKLLRVLMRARVAGFSGWGVEKLIGQLYDQTRSVAMTALAVLDEACDLKENLECVVKMKPSLLHLGDKGVMLLCRFMATSAGFKFLTDANYTTNELKKWHSSFNVRYVRIVEEQLNEALTTYEKTYEGSYTRRSSKKRQKKDVYVPTHLYGQLVQQEESYNLLRQQDHIEEYFNCVRCLDVKTDLEILNLKAALWAVGHLGQSVWGVGWLQEESLVPEIIRHAEESTIFSIRGTAFFALGLVACTREGAMLLSQYGWESRWSCRTEAWPLVEDHTALMEEAMQDPYTNVDFMTDSAKFEMSSPVSNLDYIAEERFTIGKSTNKRKGDANNDDDSDKESGSDEESGIMFDIKPRSGSMRNLPGTRLKSKTLPLPGYGFSPQRAQTMPFRSHTFRSVGVSELDKDRARSVEHIRDLQDNRISQKHQSKSVNLTINQTKFDPSNVINNNSYSAVDIHQVHHSIPTGKRESMSHVSMTIDNNATVKDDILANSAALDKHPQTVDNRTPSTISKFDSHIVEINQKSEGTGEPRVTEDPVHGLSAACELSSIEISVTDTDKVIEVSSEKTTQSQVSFSACSNQNEQNPPNPQNVESTVTLEQNIQNCENDTESKQCSKTNDKTNLQSADISDKNNTHNSENSETHKRDNGNIADKHGLQSNMLTEAKTSPENKITKELADDIKDKRTSQDSVKVKVKEERSSSSESSRTSKSRTDSFNTDATTSGIESFDSGHHGAMEFHSLSPIASNSSLNQMNVQYRPKEKKDSMEHSHHSTILRQKSNLTRVPSIRRQSSPGVNLMPTSKFFDFSDSAIMYTTAKDAIGYATLRSLMKTRQISTELDSDYGLNNLYDNMGSSTSLNTRRPSLESTTLTRPKSLLYTMSGVSLSEMDGAATIPRARLHQHRPHTGQPEFMGIALPVDIDLIFEVSEEELLEAGAGPSYSRQTSVQSHMSRKTSFMDTSSDGQTDVSASCEPPQMLDVDGREARGEGLLVMDVVPTPLSSEHNVHVCLQCRGVRVEAAIRPIDDAEPGVDRESGVSAGLPHVGQTVTRSRAGSTSDQPTSGSLTSTASDSSSKKINFDTALGRTMVRKELIRFLINLSSSVGVKGAEQGLLNLKQKFPKAFQDVCFYSDVCHLLATCSFRLTARRFIQELFEEIDISKLLSEAWTILGIEESGEKSVCDTSLPEHSDDPFEQFS